MWKGGNERSCKEEDLLEENEIKLGKKTKGKISGSNTKERMGRAQCGKERKMVQGRGADRKSEIKQGKETKEKMICHHNTNCD